MKFVLTVIAVALVLSYAAAQDIEIANLALQAFDWGFNQACEYRN